VGGMKWLRRRTGEGFINLFGLFSWIHVKQHCRLVLRSDSIACQTYYYQFQKKLEVTEYHCRSIQAAGDGTFGMDCSDWNESPWLGLHLWAA
jgi:hypothetical protein